MTDPTRDPLAVPVPILAPHLRAENRNTECPCRPCQLAQHDRCLHPTGLNVEYDQDPFGQLVDHCCCDLLERSP